MQGTLQLVVDRIILNLAPRFGIFYVCLDWCNQVFSIDIQSSYRDKWLSIEYGVQLLVTVDRDGNDYKFPIAFVIVYIESFQ